MEAPKTVSDPIVISRTVLQQILEQHAEYLNIQHGSLGGFVIDACQVCKVDTVQECDPKGIGLGICVNCGELF
mgnify:FL=1